MTAARVSTLDERYLRLDGTIYLTGLQALVRMLLDRSRHDEQAGLRTAAYVSGYEGSPLAGYDLELARQRTLLREHRITHQSGLNEELAATAVSGTQLIGGASQRGSASQRGRASQADRASQQDRPSQRRSASKANRASQQDSASQHSGVGDATYDGIASVYDGIASVYDGVTGIWYGKAPGLDRATDALRHANLIGTNPAGGAVALVGDDPAAKSSTVPSASELALADLAMPTFYPADPAEVLLHGLHAVELSRASGLWSAIKVATAVADSASTATVTARWTPPDLSDLPDGLIPFRHRPSARLLGPELAALERGLVLTRLPIAVEYIRRSGLNSVVGAPTARIGLVAAGKTYLDLRQALDALGLADLEASGIALLKLGVVFPLEPSVVTEFANGLDEIVVVEDKRPFLEDAIKSVLYGRAGAPAVHGKRDRDGSPLFSAFGELDADAVAAGLARYLGPTGLGSMNAAVTVPARRPRERITLPLAPRTPYFCSGCPHNSSTKVAPGTLVGGGIGCHAMILLMPQAQVGTVTGLSQMGGEGAQWIGMAPFVAQRHFVQNIGDGTFTHSGSLAIRAAVAAGVNVTFKLLRNSAVAMTGGQQAMGELPLDRLLALLTAEGVRKVVVTSDDPAGLRRQLGRGNGVRRGADIRHRDDLLDVQRELAAIDGVTVLVHDQECAAEKRRKRRRGKAAVPATRVFINERVCEGCGDCGAKSNCLSVQPVATEFGRKTRINQSSCNLDFSCLAGDCPSFLRITPAARVRPRVEQVDQPAEPTRAFDADGFALRITGVGGTGVVTIAQILATAAAAEGRHVRALDQTGLAQKGGAVVSDLKIDAAATEQAAKLADGECDLYLGCDSLVATDGANLRVTDPERTVAVVSTAEVPTGQMVVDTGRHFPGAGQVMSAVEESVASARFLDAAGLARELFDDEQYANMILVGVAYQAGALPIGAEAIEHAIRLNGVAADANIAAFRQGRLSVSAPAVTPEKPEAELQPTSLAALLAVRVPELAAYQDPAYAAAYAEFVERVRAREADVTGGEAGDPLARAVAANLFKLAAYKDEYEVARLSLDPDLTRQITEQFGSGARFEYRLHPPVLRSLGMRSKVSLGPWFRPAFRSLVALRRLRGTPFDPFGRTEVRRVERALVAEYRDVITRLADGLTADNHALAVEIAGLPDMVRGYEEIKLGNVRAYHQRLTELVAEFTAVVPSVTG